MKRVFSIANALIMILEEYFLPLLILTIRIWIARIFIYSGISKILNWSSTITLFKYEYQFPYLNHVLWAYISTATELISPILITIGLFTRLAAFPMLIMTAVIQLTYLQVSEHYYWVMLLGILILFGPSKISVDYYIRYKYIDQK
jgi:putative oxidoreductase